MKHLQADVESLRETEELLLLKALRFNDEKKYEARDKMLIASVVVSRLADRVTERELNHEA